MLKWCEKRAAEHRLAARLYQQAMHQLDLPRKYRTVIACGSFGLGADRGADLEGLRRMHHHLEPNGVLLLDHHLPFGGDSAWRCWAEEPDLPQPWPDRVDRRCAADGTEWELSTRCVAFNPLNQTTSREIRVRRLGGAQSPETETQTIDMNLYFKAEIELMLSLAGFRLIRVTGGLEDRPPLPWQDHRIVFEARS